jgi:hypothetical protein
LGKGSSVYIEKGTTGRLFADRACRNVWFAKSAVSRVEWYTEQGDFSKESIDEAQT